MKSRQFVLRNRAYLRRGSAIYPTCIWRSIPHIAHSISGDSPGALRIRNHGLFFTFAGQVSEYRHASKLIIPEAGQNRSLNEICQGNFDSHGR